MSDQLRLQLQSALGAGYTLELTMNVLIMGATGMVGQGVLRECLRAGDVQQVITLGRTATSQSHAKLREVVHSNLADLSAIEAANVTCPSRPRSCSGQGNARGGADGIFVAPGGASGHQRPVSRANLSRRARHT